MQSQLIRKPDPVIFDVGAAIGDVTAKYQSLFPVCTIHAFEPFPEFCQKLQGRFTGNVKFKLNQVALGETEGSVSLSSNTSPFTNSVLLTDPRAAESWGDGVLETKSRFQVPVTTLDSYCQANRVPFIDILKLDIQGGELKALRGGETILQSGRVGLVFLEIIQAPTYVGQPYFEQYLSFFRQTGYVMLDLYSTAWKGVRLLQSDVIFVRAEAGK